MKKQILSVIALVFMVLAFPAVLVCAFFYGAVWGNFVMWYDEEKGVAAIEHLWLRPCENIILWGWKQRLLERAQKE